MYFAPQMFSLESCKLFEERKKKKRETGKSCRHLKYFHRGAKLLNLKSDFTHHGLFNLVVDRNCTRSRRTRREKGEKRDNVSRNACLINKLLTMEGKMAHDINKSLSNLKVIYG